MDPNVAGGGEAVEMDPLTATIVNSPAFIAIVDQFITTEVTAFFNTRLPEVLNGGIVNYVDGYVDRNLIAILRGLANREILPGTRPCICSERRRNARRQSPVPGCSTALPPGRALSPAARQSPVPGCSTALPPGRALSPAARQYTPPRGFERLNPNRPLTAEDVEGQGACARPRQAQNVQPQNDYNNFARELNDRSMNSPGPGPLPINNPLLLLSPSQRYFVKRPEDESPICPRMLGMDDPCICTDHQEVPAIVPHEYVHPQWYLDHNAPRPARVLPTFPEMDAFLREQYGRSPTPDRVRESYELRYQS